MCRRATLDADVADVAYSCAGDGDATDDLKRAIGCNVNALGDVCAQHKSGLLSRTPTSVAMMMMRRVV